MAALLYNRNHSNHPIVPHRENSSQANISGCFFFLNQKLFQLCFLKFDVKTVLEDTSEDDLFQLVPERGMNV